MKQNTRQTPICAFTKLHKAGCNCGAATPPVKSTTKKRKPADLTEYGLRKIRREIRELKADVSKLMGWRR